LGEQLSNEFNKNFEMKYQGFKNMKYERTEGTSFHQSAQAVKATLI